jgi:hypothetical protein
MLNLKYQSAKSKMEVVLGLPFRALQFLSEASEISNLRSSNTPEIGPSIYLDTKLLTPPNIHPLKAK